MVDQFINIVKKNNHIAIFASGNGTNAQAILEYFDNHPEIHISLILSNKKDAYVLQRAKNFDIPTHVFNKFEFTQTDKVINILDYHNISFVVLAGFLWLIPTNMVKAFPDRIINIHPALLPKYGGKGMYGINVHKAVKEANESETGITIHYVNEQYDEGQIIHQAKCKVSPSDTPELIAKKVQQLEHTNYPKIIEQIISN